MNALHVKKENEIDVIVAAVELEVLTCDYEEAVDDASPVKTHGFNGKKYRAVCVKVVIEVLVKNIAE